MVANVNFVQHIYAGTLEFFYDAFGGSTIGAVWDHSVLTPRPFRVLADYSSIPIGQVSAITCNIHYDTFLTHDVIQTADKQKQKEQVKLNQTAVLAELQRLGEGLIKTIEVQKTHE